MYSHQLKMSEAMKSAIEETNRRRAVQIEYNIKHSITPTTIISRIKDIGLSRKGESEEFDIIKDLETRKKRIELEMLSAAKNLDFERAAELRDILTLLEREVV